MNFKYLRIKGVIVHKITRVILVNDFLGKLKGFNSIYKLVRRVLIKIPYGKNTKQTFIPTVSLCCFRPV